MVTRVHEFIEPWRRHEQRHTKTLMRIVKNSVTAQNGDDVFHIHRKFYVYAV
jgi:hypothetical protein